MKMTNTATTMDWLIASKDMIIRAYGDKKSSTVQMPQNEETPKSEPIFGENIKDAIRITKDWLSFRD